GNFTNMVMRWVIYEGILQHYIPYKMNLLKLTNRLRALKENMKNQESQSINEQLKKSFEARIIRSDC
ncbi:hypothetical protein, partial [Vibrio metschnikovii]|uniref:hypothetical protein n=1 Tax=Vibrio metschnikovii TaxID=28172 RepID=UPI002FCA4765